MTLDEAIKHAEEVMVENIEKTKGRNASDPIAINCFECAEEHLQLAEWLKDYKRLLAQEPLDVSNMLYDIYMEGVNMTDEYRGVWVRFKDIEKIVNKYTGGAE